MQFDQLLSQEQARGQGTVLSQVSVVRFNDAKCGILRGALSCPQTNSNQKCANGLPPGRKGSKEFAVEYTLMQPGPVFWLRRSALCPSSSMMAVKVTFSSNVSPQSPHPDVPFED